MSIEGIKAAFASPVASPTQKALMVVLGNYANQDHECWPAVATLMACTAFSERTVRNALRSLEADQLIVRRDRCNARGQTTSSSYFLAFVAQAERGTVVPIRTSIGSRKEGAGAAPPSGEGAGDAPILGGEGAGAAPNPLLNPQVQPTADACASACEAEAVPGAAFEALFGSQPATASGPAAILATPATRRPSPAAPVRDTPQQPAPPGWKLPHNPYPARLNFTAIPPEPAGDIARWMPRLSDPEHRWSILAPGEEIDPRSMHGARKQCRGAWMLRDIAATVAEIMGWHDLRRCTDWRPLCAWLDDGLDPWDTIIPTIRRVVERRGNLEISSLAYFDRAVRDPVGNRRAG